MLFTLLLLAVLIIPGYLVCEAIGVRSYRLVFSVTFSYFIFIVFVGISRTNLLTVSNSGFFFLTIICGLLLTLIATRRLTKRRDRNFISEIFSSSIAITTIVSIVVGVSVYYLAIGIYDEIPADLYQHIGFANQVFQRLESQGFTGGFSDFFDRSRSKNIWYMMVVWCAQIANVGVIEVIPHVIISCSIIFFLATVSVADRLFQPLLFTYRQQQATIIMAVAFVFTQMGINAFSYVRYYSFAPTIINYVVYFAGLICLVDLFSDHGKKVQSLVFIMIALIVACVVHPQEGLFILVATTLLIYWWGIARFIKYKDSSFWGWFIPLLTMTIFTVALALAYFWIRGKWDITPFYNYKVIPFPLTLPKIGPLYILDPSYQFYRVITIWGVLVYFLFFSQFKKFLGQPILILGMLSPLVTVFNPFFTDVFLRMGQSTTLWRLCYFIPLHFVGAALMVMLYKLFRQSSIINRCYAGVGILFMVVLLLPSVFSIPVNAYAKTTLSKVENENRWAYWSDLIDYLNQNDYRDLGVSSRVLADPVTGYVVQALTPYSSYQFKFLPTSSYHRNTFVFESYEDFPLSKYAGKLLIVNRRNGAKSKTGLISGHWHEDVLTVSDYYPDALSQHLEAYPDRFDKHWESDRIQVYRIK